MRFERLQLAEWRQFEQVDIDFHPSVTVITGANGSGKTGILRLLARQFGWSYSEVATPLPDKQSGLIRYIPGWIRWPWTQPAEAAPARPQIGTLWRSPDHRSTPIRLPELQSAQYQPIIDIPLELSGLFIPSHRPEFSTQQVTSIPTTAITKLQAFNDAVSAYRNRAQGGGGASSNFIMKQALISWAAFGYGNQVMPPDPAKQLLFAGFEEVLRLLLPESLGFESLAVAVPDITLQTKTGVFNFDAVSGGIAALIDLAWQIYMFDPGHGRDQFTVVIDEVENHLHATMQRALLPSLIRAFPGVQFIVSTHSPLIVGSVRESAVYVLRYTDEGKVVSQRLDMDQKVGSATQILREVLGVETSLPLWVEEELSGLVGRYETRPVNKVVFDSIKHDLAAIGLEEFAPQTIAEFVRTRRTVDQAG